MLPKITICLAIREAGEGERGKEHGEICQYHLKPAMKSKHRSFRITFPDRALIAVWGWRLCSPLVTVGPEQCHRIHPQQPAELTGAGWVQKTSNTLFFTASSLPVNSNAFIHNRLIGVQCKLQWVNHGGMTLLRPLSTYCQVLLYVHVCVCVFFKAWAFLGVGGKEKRRQQLFRKAASPVKFTKYHQYCWTNE